MRLSALSLVLFAFSFVLPQAFAADSADAYTYGDAAGVAIKATGTEALTAAALQLYGFAATAKPLDNASVAKALEDADIERILARVEDSPLNRFGFNQIGGAQLQVTYDAAQYERMLGASNGSATVNKFKGTEILPEEMDLRVGLAKSPAGAVADKTILANAMEVLPQYETKAFNVLTIGDSDALKARLVALKDAGVAVKEVTFRGLIPRAGGAVVGTAQLLMVAGASTNLANSALYAMISSDPYNNTQWVAQRCGGKTASQATCESAGVFDLVFDSAEYIFYNVKADPQN